MLSLKICSFTFINLSVCAATNASSDELFNGRLLGTNCWKCLINFIKSSHGRIARSATDPFSTQRMGQNLSGNDSALQRLVYTSLRAEESCINCHMTLKPFFKFHPVASTPF